MGPYHLSMSCSTAGVMSRLDLANITIHPCSPNDTIWITNTNIRLHVTPGCDWHQLVNADPVSALQRTEQSRVTITIQDVRVSPELGQKTSHCLSTSRHSSIHQWSDALALPL